MSLVERFSERSSAIVVALLASFGLSACGTLPANVIKHSLRRDAVGVVEDASHNIKEGLAARACKDEYGNSTIVIGKPCSPRGGGYAEPRPSGN